MEFVIKHNNMIKDDLTKTKKSEETGFVKYTLLTELTDEELVEKVKNKSDAAYSELINRYMKKTYSIALKMIGDQEAARDLSQDVFLKIYKTLHTFKEGSKFFSWYYRILLNHCINYQRRKKLVSLIPFSEAFIKEDKNFEDNVLVDEDTEVENDNTKLVRLAIDKLSPKHQRVIVLYDIEGFPQEEISEIIGISVGTVRSRLHYARKSLKQIIKSLSKEI